MKTIIAILLSGFCLVCSAQNVGIGTLHPNNGRLVLNNNGSTSALVINDSATGLSLGDQDNPLIGFNNYFRTGRKFMSNGYASYLWFNASSGLLSYFNTSVSGTQGALPSMTNRFVIDKDGEVGIGVPDPAAGLHIRGKSLLVDNTSGFGDVSLTATGSTIGGLVELRNNTNIRTVALRAGDGSGVSGEMIFYNNTGTTSTLELDGDYGASGRSRIIVDELQIKGGADFAEYFDIKTTGNTLAEPGMLVSIDELEEGKMTLSTKAYDKKVAGVISGANGIKPGVTMSHKGTIADGKEPVAISGRVYVKAETMQSAIRPGDLLTTSVTPGFAMKAVNHKKAAGAIIGKAMSSMDAGKTGFVLVLLSIQ